MTTIRIPTRVLREAKRLFGRLRRSHKTLPVLTHILLTAGPDGIRLTVTDLDHWIETRVSTDACDPVRFLIPPDAFDASCRGDRGSFATFTTYGGRRSKEIGLVVIQGGIEATSVHPTLDENAFPELPALVGETTTLPADTIRNLDSVAGCASKDITRHILNGVYFTPDEGGRLVATDGKRLAVCPADTPPHSFVLPMGPVSILRHPAFGSSPCEFTWLDAKDPDKRRVAFRSGPHLLVATTLAGRYPDFQQVIPRDAPHRAHIADNRIPGLIAWLRGLKAPGHRDPSVRLDWKHGSILRHTHRSIDGRSTTLEVPVELHGSPPAIAFHPAYLADALDIGSTLCLSDELTPGIFRHPSGRFCVLMPMRVCVPATGTDTPQVAA